MSTPSLYGVYTAQFPFLDSQDAKLRPVIVVSKPYGEHNIVGIVPVSSQPTHEIVDVVLSYWENEGLLKPSVARVHRLTTMLQADLISELGSLQPDDTEALQVALRDFLQL